MLQIENIQYLIMPYFIIIQYRFEFIAKSQPKYLLR